MVKKNKKKEFFFKKICQAFPKKYKFNNKKISFNLLLSNNKNIKKLNKIFRKKNKSTDVLSFPFNENFKLSKEKHIGDIIISYNFMNKPKFQKLEEFENKVIKTFIHAYLHLLGFNHVKDKDFKKMQKEEDYIYKFIKSKIY